MSGLGQSEVSPGTYQVPMRPAEPQRAKPMFTPGTVHHAAELADFVELERLIRQGKENGYHESVVLQEKEDLLGMMPIHVACEKGHLQLVQYLVKKRVDLDAGDKFRVTALHLASIENHIEVAQFLLASKANVKPPDVEGDLPVHWAATRGHVEMLQLLVRYGSPVDPTNKQSWTPLHRASYNGRKESCVALVNAGASLMARNKDGNTPLHLACFMNQLAVIEALLGLSARTDSVNVAGKQPLDLCITDAARELVNKHASKFAPPKPPTGKPSTPAGEALDVDRERTSARMDTSRLVAKHRALEEFPDVDAPASPRTSGGNRNLSGAAGRTSGGPRRAGHEDEEESTLYMRTSGGHAAHGRSDFLSEASGGFDDRSNPYTMGYQNLGTNVVAGAAEERTSGRSLRTTPSFGSGRLAPRQSGGLERTSAGSHAIRSTASGVATRTSVAAKPVQSLSGRVSVPAAGSGGLPGWEGSDRLSAAEYNQRVKDENRKSAAAGR